MLTNVAEPSVVDRLTGVAKTNSAPTNVVHPIAGQPGVSQMTAVKQESKMTQNAPPVIPNGPSRSATSADVVANRRRNTEQNPQFLGNQRFTMPETPEPTKSNNEPAPEAVSEKDLVQVFKLLADETRLKILLSLQREGELHVSALCDRLNQSQPAVSHHLALLRDAGLIRPRRDGKHNYYSVRREHFEKVMGGLFDSMLEPQPTKL